MESRLSVCARVMNTSHNAWMNQEPFTLSLIEKYPLIQTRMHVEKCYLRGILFCYQLAMRNSTTHFNKVPETELLSSLALHFPLKEYAREEM